MSNKETTKELVKVKIPQIPKVWDYGKSIEKVKGVIYKWKNLTVKMAQELYIAREKLRAQGKRTDLKPGDKSSQVKKDWGDYCREITGHEDKKVARDIVNRWLSRFFEENEYETKKKAKKKDVDFDAYVEETAKQIGNVAVRLVWIKQHVDEYMKEFNEPVPIDYITKMSFETAMEHLKVALQGIVEAEEDHNFKTVKQLEDSTEDSEIIEGEVVG